MKKILFGFIVTVFIIAGAIYVSPKSGECEDCKEQETGAIPDYGTCYFE